MWSALLGLSHDIKQLARYFIRITGAQAVFAVLNQQTDISVHLADQLAHFSGMAFQRALLQTLQYASGDPPQPPTVHVITARSDRHQGLAHGDQLLR